LIAADVTSETLSCRFGPTRLNIPTLDLAGREAGNDATVALRFTVVPSSSNQLADAALTMAPDSPHAVLYRATTWPLATIGTTWNAFCAALNNAVVAANAPAREFGCPRTAP
jgi:hypothetical protein